MFFLRLKLGKPKMRDGRADPLMGCLRDGSAIDRLTDYISWFCGTAVPSTDWRTRFLGFAGRHNLRPDDGLDFLVLRDGTTFDRMTDYISWFCWTTVPSTGQPSGLDGLVRTVYTRAEP
jgi:hypothetical protein